MHRVQAGAIAIVWHFAMHRVCRQMLASRCAGFARATANLFLVQDNNILGTVQHNAHSAMLLACLDDVCQKDKSQIAWCSGDDPHYSLCIYVMRNAPLLPCTFANASKCIVAIFFLQICRPSAAFNRLVWVFSCKVLTCQHEDCHLAAFLILLTASLLHRHHWGVITKCPQEACWPAAGHFFRPALPIRHGPHTHLPTT